jgi:hypothetical protein
MSVADRARTLNRIADRMEEYLPFLAADAAGSRSFPLLCRLQEGSLGQLDPDGRLEISRRRWRKLRRSPRF